MLGRRSKLAPRRSVANAVGGHVLLAVYSAAMCVGVVEAPDGILTCISRFDQLCSHLGLVVGVIDHMDGLICHSLRLFNLRLGRAWLFSSYPGQQALFNLYLSSSHLDGHENQRAEDGGELDLNLPLGALH